MVKTRFAPSPTGELHIGAARTALFSYLFAKNQGGEFLLRIEDTDQKRSTKEFEKNIFDGLSWLGLDHDGKVLYQSERLEIYKQKAQELIKAGMAKEKDGAIVLDIKVTLDELKIKYEEALKIATQWSRQRPEEKLTAYFVRDIGQDLIHGAISGMLSDTVLLRSDGTPTFHLAVVIDDEFLDITHVIRGDDHLSNTPLHIVLQKSLGYKTPKYAHIPMILGPDHAKLSKRHGATSVLEYKNQGYLPQALVNFMALLGWNPKDDREIFSLDDLIKEFDLKNVNKSGAIFDIEKLNWMNGEYIKMQISNIKMTDQNAKMLKEWGVEELSQGELQLIGRGGFKTLKEAAGYIIELRKEPEYNASLLIFKKSDRENTLKGLELAKKKIEAIPDQQYSNETIEQSLAEAVSEGQLSNGDVFWPLRVALSGAEKSPSPVELLLALGKDESIKRIHQGIEKLKQLSC